MDMYCRSGIKQLKLLDYALKYIGQTERAFNTRYKEHIETITTVTLENQTTY
jgi:hypothetical protein